MFLQRWRASGARIRKLGLDDAPRLPGPHASGFARGWSEDEFETLLGDPTVVGHGAVLGTEVLAFGLTRTAADEAELLTIVTGPEWRGCGLAPRVLERALDGAANRGARRLFLEVDAGNAPALAVYRRFGFGEVGRRRGYYAADGGGDALVLALDVSARRRAPLPDSVEF